MIDCKSAGEVAIDRLAAPAPLTDEPRELTRAYFYPAPHALARFTDEPGELTRLYLSPAHKAAALQVLAWMTEAGMETRIDAAGNVVGRYEGIKPGLPSLLHGSHIDTVRNAGKYDGN